MTRDSDFSDYSFVHGIVSTLIGTIPPQWGQVTLIPFANSSVMGTSKALAIFSRVSKDGLLLSLTMLLKFGCVIPTIEASVEMDIFFSFATSLILNFISVIFRFFAKIRFYIVFHYKIVLNISFYNMFYLVVIL